MEVCADSQLLSDTKGRMGFMRNMATRIKAGPPCPKLDRAHPG